MSSPKDRKDKGGKNIRLGKKVGGEYKYNSKVDFTEDLSVQIDKLMQEKQANESLDANLRTIERAITGFASKEKNIAYYWEIGKLLSFLNSADFINIKPYSVARRIAEEIPGIVPGIEEKRIADHIVMMYRLGQLPFTTVEKASWEQWYEITKFKGLTDNLSKLENILTIAGKSTGPDLRRKIQDLD